MNIIKLKPIHPFPARMAPEIVLEECRELPLDATILDPMAGSGTVLRVAAETGRTAVGCDFDPLAVIISSAWTSGIAPESIVPAADKIVRLAKSLSKDEIHLPWMQDPETATFVDYWFAAKQRDDLERLSACLIREIGDIGDILRVCLSRIIITKEKGASLARDVSHSRPHKVRDENDFDVMSGFMKSAASVAKYLSVAPITKRAKVTRGDARNLIHLPDSSFNAVITSPPYLNAIDYMRGHKLALIWLGYSIPELRAIRSASVGSERGAKAEHVEAPILDAVRQLSWFTQLPKRESNLVCRYVNDIYALVCEISRLLIAKGKAVLVVGNSCLKGIYIENSHVVELAARCIGLECTGVYVRDLPSSSRYLPMPSGPYNDDLGKRMRKECVLSFTKA